MEQTPKQAEKQLALEKEIGSMVFNGFTERGCESYRSESGATVLFAKVCSETNSYIQISYTPENYPAYDIGEVKMTDEEMKDFVVDNYDGWFCCKTQLDIPLADGYVYSEYEDELEDECEEDE